MTSVDFAVLTAKREEFTAFRDRLENPSLWPGTREQPNQYAWTRGEIGAAGGAGSYTVALALTHEQTNIPAALATLATFGIFKPRYIVFMGIAGSLDPSLRKGDVFIADYVWDYEYGRISESGQYEPRSQFQEATDAPLRTNAVVFADTNKDWQRAAGHKLGLPGEFPALQTGGLASGDKVVEGVNSDYFSAVRKPGDWLRAVDMESAGVAQAVRNLREAGAVTGLMVLRGISDVPGDTSTSMSEASSDGANRLTRQQWTAYASRAAAAFLAEFIKHAAPFAPQRKQQLESGALDRRRLFSSHLIKANELSTIHALNDECFRASDLVPRETLEAWWRVNPLTIGLVTTEGGEPVGYWHILPLRQSAFDAVLAGTLVERDIGAAHIVSYREFRPGSVYVYVTALCARSTIHFGSAAVILDLVGFLQLIHGHVGIDGVSAQSVSEDPLDIIKRFGMRPVDRPPGTGGVHGGTPPTWLLAPREEVARAFDKGRKCLASMKDRVPQFSPIDRHNVLASLQA